MNRDGALLIGRVLLVAIFPISAYHKSSNGLASSAQ